MKANFAELLWFNLIVPYCFFSGMSKKIRAHFGKNSNSAEGKR